VRLVADGRYLMFRTGTSLTGDGFDLWILPLFGDRKSFPYITGPGDQLYAQFSPDGRWVAYTSSETGRNEVYVAPFPRQARSGRSRRTAGPCRAGDVMVRSCSLQVSAAASLSRRR